MRRLAVGIIVTLIAAASPAAAAIKLDPSPDAEGRKVVNAVFREYIAQRVGVKIETTVVDVEGDGVAEIVARFVHSGSCRNATSQCRTVVIRHNDRKWGIVFDRPTDELSIDKPRAKWNFTDIVADGMTWKWNGKAYSPTAGSFGTQVSFAPVPKESAAAIAAAFGQGAVKLASNSDSNVSFEYARPKVAQSGEHLLVRMKGDVVCGNPAGCPVRLLEKAGNSWTPILEASSTGGVEVARISRGGRNDIVVATDKGFAVLGWTGKSYGLADVIEATAK